MLSQDIYAKIMCGDVTSNDFRDLEEIKRYLIDKEYEFPALQIQDIIELFEIIQSRLEELKYVILAVQKVKSFDWEEEKLKEACEKYKELIND